jgi:hypothetical protein
VRSAGLLLFALPIVLGAALLFWVQPMAAKAVLPLLGGSPSVWNTCMLFFQAMLLAGYVYAHLTTSWLGVRRQAVVHAALLLVSLAFWPQPTGGSRLSSPGAHPASWLLGHLLASIGLPFFVLATTSPLLQRWFAHAGHSASRDPYFLYATSNLGSMLALLSYPLVVEPILPLARQGQLWSAGYALLVALTLACVPAAWRSRGPSTEEVPSDPAPTLDRPEWRRRLRWVFLAFVPSSLMLGATTYLSTDIAPVPLLWVVPLAIYLLTFILAFARRPIVPHAAMVRALPIAAMLLAPALAAGLVQPFWIPLHLLTFALAAMVCHGELARDRPSAQHLTEFYLALSLGGALGGVFNALIAPLIFDRVAEYPLAIVLACLALPGRGPSPLTWPGLAREVAIPATIFLVTAALVTDLGGIAETVVGVAGVMIVTGLVALLAWSHRGRPIRFALGLGAALLASGLSPGVDGRPLARRRDFYGILRVTSVDRGRFHRLFHGSTLHGQQCFDPDRRRDPLTYFTRTGPIGQVFSTMRDRPGPRSVAVVGLGAGSLACYAESGDRWTFYELDPAVVRIARDPRFFTFLRDCPARSLTLVEGDARLRLAEAPDGGYDLIVLDAFGSDAAPMHLLTREALRLYRRKLSPGGLLAFNLSSRYLDLDTVVDALAADAGLACRVCYDVDVSPAEVRDGKQPSIWAVLAASPADLGPLANDPRWVVPRLRPGQRPWTDDFSDILGAFRLRRRWPRPSGPRPDPIRSPAPPSRR